MRIKFRNWKGLYTNIDASDKGVEHFSKFKDIKVHPGFIESKGLSFDEQAFDLPADYTFIRQQYVFLDEDKYQNELADNELKNTYVQNIQKYLFQILSVLINGNNTYCFRLKKDEENWEWVYYKEYGNTYYLSDAPNQYPKIINEQGNLKILFKKETIWIGRINRSVWDGSGTTTTIANGFYLYPLVEEYKANAEDSLFKFKVETDQSLPTTVKVDRGAEFRSYPFIHQGIGKTLDAVAYELVKDEDGEQVLFSNYTGMLILGKVAVVQQTVPNITYCVAFWKGHTDIMPHPVSDITLANQSILIWKLDDSTHPNEPFWNPTGGNFSDRSQWVFFVTNESFDIPVSLINWLEHPDLAVNLTAINLEKYFLPGSDIELLTTVIVNNGEYIIDYKNISNAQSEFIIKINLNPFAITEAYKNKINANVYFRYRDSIAEVKSKDFELCYSYQFTTSKLSTSARFINNLTPNGIFLTQMIGKFFDPNTYKIITAFDDYCNVAGVPYILKNSNVHYPAVGGGSILNNFYYENVVPGIEGERLIAFANLLGVFSPTKELMTLIDFSPVESSMIFYIKDTLQYKVRDEKDIIETPEGIFIHLKEGIYVTNGRERTLISEPINDIIKANYTNGNIFYNSYHKQLFYLTVIDRLMKLYCFDFETQSWIEYSLPETFNIENPIIDFIEDYLGKIYFITKGTSYVLEFISREGLLELSYIDLQEYSISKRINYLVADHIGNIKATDIAESNGGDRAIRYLFNKLDNRKPIKNIVVEVKFNGTLYGIEMDIETMRTEQL